MKVLLEIQENRSDFFMEMLKSLKYISVLGIAKEKKQEEAITNLVEAFQNVNQYEKGEKKLKNAKDLLNEL
jgi:hypothetical protein